MTPASRLDALDIWDDSSGQRAISPAKVLALVEKLEDELCDRLLAVESALARETERAEKAKSRLAEAERLLRELAPVGVEQACDKCGGNPTDCADEPRCAIREARVFLSLTDSPDPFNQERTMTTMRAKVRVSNVETYGQTHAPVYEQLTFHGVAKSDGYPSDGSDENNTFAKWSPSVEFKMTVTNPALYGKFAVGDTFYVDFTPAPK